MARKRERTNPFYVLLVAVGVIFTLTAISYGMMTLKAIRTLTPADLENDAGLLGYMDRHGLATMALELAVLATATVGAMATDRYWSAPAERDQSGSSPPGAPAPPRDKPA